MRGRRNGTRLDGTKRSGANVYAPGLQWIVPRAGSSAWGALPPVGVLAWSRSRPLAWAGQAWCSGACVSRSSIHAGERRHGRGTVWDVCACNVPIGGMKIAEPGPARPDRPILAQYLSCAHGSTRMGAPVRASALSRDLRSARLVLALGLLAGVWARSGSARSLGLWPCIFTRFQVQGLCACTFTAQVGCYCAMIIPKVHMAKIAQPNPNLVAVSGPGSIIHLVTWSKACQLLRSDLATVSSVSPRPLLTLRAGLDFPSAVSMIAAGQVSWR